MQKQAKIKMNHIDSRKLGAPPQLPSCEGKLPTLPPAPASRPEPLEATGPLRAPGPLWAPGTLRVSLRAQGRPECRSAENNILDRQGRRGHGKAPTVPRQDRGRCHPGCLFH